MMEFHMFVSIADTTLFYIVLSFIDKQYNNYKLSWPVIGVNSFTLIAEEQGQED